jgi:hypothetical protein
MYLPVLLIDRFGWPGFAAFAVPNVFGCSAMGFVLSRRGTTPSARERSQASLAKHRRMMVAFSLVTIAYQVFFAVWLVSELIPRMSQPQWAPLTVGVVVCLLGMLFGLLNDRDWLGLAIVTYLISLAAIIAIGTGGFDRVPMSGSLAPQKLWWLLPTLCFGFLLCPYLDLTFHRAVQASSQPRVSFAIFGIAFAIMLGLTAMLWFSPDVWYRRLTAQLAVGHVLAQLIFTIGAHMREVRLSGVFENAARRIATMLAPLLAAAALLIARLMLDETLAGEWTYLAFLSCYGLLFPAYVIVAMATGSPLRSRAAWLAFAALIVLGMPLYAKGFLYDQTPWLVPPVVAFLAWGLLRRK